MNRASGVLKMHMRDKFSWYMLPWMIMLFSFFVNLIIGFFIKYSASETFFITGGISSIFVYMLIIGMVSLSQSFTYTLGMGVRRTDYFKGTMAMVGIVGAATAIALAVLAKIEIDLTGGWGVQLRFFNLPYLNDGSFIEQIVVYFSLLVNLFLFGFVIACLYRRFGGWGVIGLCLGLLLITSIGSFVMTYYELWGQAFEWFIQYSAVQHSIWLLGAAVIYAIFSYLMLSKSTTLAGIS
ncbi:hypothetical protein [Paenibacillus marinisediminis]